MKNNYEIKKKIVLEGNSRVYNNWKAHTDITVNDFINGLEWVCNDPCNGGIDGTKLTREIGLTPNGIIKLNRYYGKEDLCAFYDMNGNLWDGAFFRVTPQSDKEIKYYGTKEFLVLRKISLSCMDHV